MIRQKPLVLASGSPRRKELLRMLGLRFEVQVADIQEAIPPDTPPEEMVQTLAKRKAMCVARDKPAAVVLGADTVVALGDEVLGKPVDETHARGMLRMLSGRWHEVYTGWWVCDQWRPNTPRDGRGGVVRTKVRFSHLSDADIREYVEACCPLDKAGAYGVQERIAAFIPEIQGCFYNVMGLPVAAVAQALRCYGIRPI